MSKRSSFLTKRKKPKSFVDLPLLFTGSQAFSVIIYGKSRSGKTVHLVNLMDTFIGSKHYNFINDCAKGYSYEAREPRSELLMFFSDSLSHIKGMRIITPPECSVYMENVDGYKIYSVSSYEEIFDIIQKGGPYVNVIAVDSFLLSPLARARFWALFCIELKARIFPDRKKETPLPMVGALDQINLIFPSKALRLGGIGGHIQSKSANWFADFMYNAAGSGLRILATSHGITQVKKPIRDAFLWKFFKTFSGDVEPVAKRMTPIRRYIERLEKNEAYILDDGNMGDFYKGIPNVEYEPGPVYYEGNRIIKELWMLESDYKTLVLTPNEMKALMEKQNAPKKHELEYLEIGIEYLGGKSCREVAKERGISLGKVNDALEYCRNHPIIGECFRHTENIMRPKGRVRYPPPPSSPVMLAEMP